LTFPQTARRLVLPVFRRVNIGDVTIRHHWTGYPLRLHSFKHKGYWWYGRKRERESMELFAKLIPRGSVVVEIGGHIGYVAQYLSMLIGPEGHLFCFEPSPENLPYLKKNAQRSSDRNIDIVEAAAGDHDGSAQFFYESITGQNSTTVADFKGLEINSGFNALPVHYQTCTVAMRKVDSFLAEHGLEAGFIKIDAEGGERDILIGMTGTMRYHPRMMVEVNTHHSEVFGILTSAGYVLFNPAGIRVSGPDPAIFSGNIFATHETDENAMRILGDWALECRPSLRSQDQDRHIVTPLK
jgi:FkbM family methyltransferase